MITLHTYATPNGYRASIALEELALPYDLRVVDLAKGQQLTAEYGHVSPIGKVPAIVDDGRTVFGSTAILYHLAETRGALMPADPAARTQAHVWMAFAAGDLGPSLVSRYYFGTLAEDKPPAAIAHFDRETGRCLRALEARLGEAPHLAGEDYSIADIAVFPFVAVLAGVQSGLLAERPHLRRWHDAVAARPAVVRGMAVPALG